MTETETETTATSKAVAKHFLLTSTGEVTEKEEEATGIRYVSLASGRTLDFQVPGAVAGTPVTMGAVFGFKTLATNEASAMRQKEGPNSDQIGAIEERFALISTGQWVDRTREGGPRTDPNDMALAAINVEDAAHVEAGGVAYNPQTHADRVAKLVAIFTKHPEKVKQIGQIAGVAAEYARLRGKATRSISELADLMKLET